MFPDWLPGNSFMVRMFHMLTSTKAMSLLNGNPIYLPYQVSFSETANLIELKLSFLYGIEIKFGRHCMTKSERKNMSTNHLSTGYNTVNCYYFFFF
jgi:hypothetical protein